MARRRVEIKPILDKAKRQTTFTKRRYGLFKKAVELCEKCDAQAAVIAFSNAGNLYGLGHPSVDTVVDRYAAARGLITGDGVEEETAEEEETVEEEVELTEAGRRMFEAVEIGNWDRAVEDLRVDGLDELAAEVGRFKLMVAAARIEAAGRNGDNSGTGESSRVTSR